jgi:hypothetical protein
VVLQKFCLKNLERSCYQHHLWHAPPILCKLGERLLAKCSRVADTKGQSPNGSDSVVLPLFNIATACHYQPSISTPPVIQCAATMEIGTGPTTSTLRGFISDSFSDNMVRSFQSCVLALLVCYVMVLLLSSMMPRHSHELKGPSNKTKFCSLSWPLRRETIRALSGDRRWTREACVEHWAAGIDTVAIAKLADKRIFLAMNLRDNEQGKFLIEHNNSVHT